MLIGALEILYFLFVSFKRIVNDLPHIIAKLFINIARTNNMPANHYCNITIILPTSFLKICENLMSECQHL